MIEPPYYLIDKSKLLRNLRAIEHFRKHSGTKVVLALKCFATRAVFDLMRGLIDGATTSREKSS